MEIGDVVIPRDPKDFCHTGTCYSHAIVINNDPIILVSEDTEMRWQYITEDKVMVVGTAKPSVLLKCYRRRFE